MTEDEQKLSTRQRLKVRQIANELSSAFIWMDTKDGAAFWNDVRDRLIRIASEGR